MLRPPCSRCGRPTILTRIEPEQPGFEVHIYYCASCNACDVATVDVDSPSLGRDQSVVPDRKVPQTPSEFP
jgi:hypothetical protein